MRVSVSGKQFVFPRSCACCGAYPLTTLPVSGAEKNKKARTRGWVWDIPYCSSCKRHIRAIEGISLVVLFLIAASFSIGMYVLAVTRLWELGLEAWMFSTAFTGSLAWASIKLVRRRSSKNCCGLGRAVAYQGSVGTCHSFDLKSGFYAAEFVRANHKKLVNVTPQVASILRGTKFGEHQVPRRLLRHQKH